EHGGGAGEAERLAQGVVQQGVDGGADQGPRQERDPGDEQLARGGADTAAGCGGAEVAALEVEVEALEVAVVVGDVADVHAEADLAPEVEVAEALLLAEGPPAEAGVPADGLEDEGGEDVEEVGVGDLEAAVELVDAAEGALAAVAVVAVLE